MSTLLLFAPEGQRSVATGGAVAAQPADAQPVEPDSPPRFLRAPAGRRKFASTCRFGFSDRFGRNQSTLVIGMERASA